MSEPKAQSWWQTVPGMLTGAAAVITAITGLMLALSQTGWLGRKSAAEADSTHAVSETTSPAKASRSANAQRLSPALQQVKLGTGEFTLLNISTERRTADQIGLRIHVRLQNHGPYPVNFWNDLFRLEVDDVPRAPVGDLNKVLAGNAAEEGDVEFTFPANAKSLALKIRFYGEETSIPLQAEN